MSHTPTDRPAPLRRRVGPVDRRHRLEPGADPQLSGRNKFLGAMFLMATSAIGPGFITQTVAFTDQLAAAFAFAIVVSILFDIAIQLNVWRVIGVSGRRAQDLANGVRAGRRLRPLRASTCWAAWSSTSATSRAARSA